MLELNSLYNMDCMDGMAMFPNGYFNLAVVDPPYGIGVNHNMGRRHGDAHSSYKKVTWDDAAPTADYFMELRRVSKNQIIFGANHFIDRIPINSPCWIVWDKLFSEEMSFAGVELAWTSFDTPSKKVQISSQQPDRIHPTQKPVKLYKWVLSRYANPGDKIIDTHAGSASSLIACHDLRLDYIGFEIDEEYYEKASKRLAENAAQITMNLPTGGGRSLIVYARIVFRRKTKELKNDNKKIA